MRVRRQGNRPFPAYGRDAGRPRECRAIEQISPELVLVSPELRLRAPYGPYVPRRPARIEPLGTPTHAPPRSVELTLRVPVLLVAIVGALVKVALQATTIVLGFVVLVGVLALLAR